ncbi:hypothetical protein MMPV_002057 [Pyropia vietnamensis]
MDQTFTNLNRAEEVDLAAAAGRSSRTRLAAARLECYLGHYGAALTWAAILVAGNFVFFARAAIAEYFRQAGAAPWRRAWIPLARGAGALLNLNSAVVLLPAVRVLVDYLRQSSVNLVLPLDHAMPFFHKVVACVLLGAGTFHGLVQTAALATAPAAHPLAGLLYITGWLLVVAVAAMLTTAWSRCRQRYFELFQATHALGVLTYYAALLPHGMHRGRHVTWMWVAAPLLLYALDRLVLRNSHSRRVLVTLDRTHTEVVCNGTVLKLAIETPFLFRPGQYVRIKVPSMSRQWHPFTIASAPHEAQLLLYIRRHGEGQWTARLHDLVAGLSNHGRDGNGVGSIEILIEGPFGAPSEHVGQFEHVVLFAGGVGATVYVSVVKAIHHFMEGQRATATAKRAAAATSAVTPGATPWGQGGRRPAGGYSPARPGRLAVSGGGRAAAHPLTTPTRRAGAAVRHGAVAESDESPWHPSFGDGDGDHGWGDFPSNSGGGGGGGGGSPDISPCKARLYLALYSVTLNLALLWALLLRVLLLAVSYAIAIDSVDASYRPVMLPFTSVGMVAVDTLLAGAILATLLLSVAVEASLMGVVATFRPASKGFPLAALLASAAIATAINAAVLAEVPPLGGDGPSSRLAWEVANLTNGAVLAVSLAARLARVIGGRVALATHRGNRAAHLKSVDFFWTAPTAADDAWVMHELDRAILRSTPVSLRRFLTRHQGVFVTRAWPTKKLVTTLGRPDIEAELRALVAKLPSGATVGVFFCGPAAMGESIRRAVMVVTSESLVAAMSTSEAPSALVRLLAERSPTGADRGGKAYGHNVRLIFRQEVFL